MTLTEMNNDDATLVAQELVDAALKQAQSDDSIGSDKENPTPAKKSSRIRRKAAKVAAALKPSKLFQFQKKAVPDTAAEKQAVAEAVAFDIEVEKDPSATAPPLLLARIRERRTSLADSAAMRHAGAAQRRAEAEAKVRVRLADRAAKRQAAAARRAAGIEPDDEEMTAEAAPEKAVEVPPLESVPAHKRRRGSFLGKLLSPRKFAQKATPKPALPAPCAFEIEVQKKASAVAPAELVARIAARRTNLAGSAVVRHAAATTRRAAAAGAVQRKLELAFERGLRAQVRRTARIETLRASIEAKNTAAGARAAAAIAGRAAVAAEMNARVVAAADRRMQAVAAETTAACIELALLAANPAAAKEEAEAPKEEPAKPAKQTPFFKLPFKVPFFGGKASVAAAAFGGGMKTGRGAAAATAA